MCVFLFLHGRKDTAKFFNNLTLEFLGERRLCRHKYAILDRHRNKDQNYLIASLSYGCHIFLSLQPRSLPPPYLGQVGTYCTFHVSGRIAILIRYAVELFTRYATITFYESINPFVYHYFLIGA